MLTPRILIVEDDPLIRADLRRTFLSSPPDMLGAVYGDVKFEVETAVTAQEARERLTNAIATHRPYDIVLFDLGLPRDAEHLDDHDDARGGLDVLLELQSKLSDNPDEVAADVIVVASGHRQIDVLEVLLKTQLVADFIGKPWDELNEIPYRRVMDALKLHREKQSCEWARWKANRMRTWCIGAIQQHVLLNHNQLVTTGVSNAERELRQLRRPVEEICNISFDFDREHPVVTQWGKAHDAVIKIATDVTEAIQFTSKDFTTAEIASDAPTTVKEIIEAVLGNVRSGCVSRGLSVTVSGSCDVPLQPPLPPVSVVLEEILHGIIEVVEQGQAIEVAVSEKQFSVTITVTDHGPTLSMEERLTIDDEDTCHNVGGRVWGLALAKHVAWSSGAQLTVGAAPHEPGNVVTLCLPRLRS